MHYLLLAIVCSAAIALVFRYSEITGRNRYAVTSANYLAACLVAAALAARAARPAPDALRWALLVGLGAGFFFFAAFISYQVSVRRHGVGLAGAFAKLGILLPMALSLVLWREQPSALQWLGIALACMAIVAVNLPAARGGEKASLRRALRPALLLLFLFGGIAEFSNKVFQRHGLPEAKSIFLLATFAVAFLFSLGALARARRPVRAGDALVGVAVGIPNLFSSFFLILALDRMPAAVAFPAYGAGTILILALAGAGLFRERLSGREWLAMAMITAALVLINL